MTHSIKVAIGKSPPTDGIVSCRRVRLREKLLERILGPMRDVVVLVSGKTVDSITVSEAPEGGESHE